MGSKICGNLPSSDNVDPYAMINATDPEINDMKYDKDDKVKCWGSPQTQKIIDSFVEELIVSQSLYKDLSLPTEPVILRSKNKELKKEIECKHLRPFQFLPNLKQEQKYHIVNKHSITPSSIEVKDELMQFFGTFLCFLADKPELIENIILTEANKFGLHCIKAYIQGEVKLFLIDDYILVQKTSQWPIFSQPVHKKYMWTCLLEKAWFKMKTFSKRIKSESPEEVIRSFLSFPVQKIILTSFDESENREQILRQKLNNCFINYENEKDKGFIFKTKAKKEHDIGLGPHQYYYLLDTFKVNDESVYYLRNPCKQEDFRGFYDKLKDEKVYKKIEKLANEDKNGGNILVTENEIIEQFAQIIKIDYHKEYEVNRLIMKNFPINRQVFMRFETKKDGFINLSLEQFSTGQLCPLSYQLINETDLIIEGGKLNDQASFGEKKIYLFDEFTKKAQSSRYLIRLQFRSQKPETELYKIVFYTYFFEEGLIFEEYSENLQKQYKELWWSYLKKIGRRKIQDSSSVRDKSQEIEYSLNSLGDIAFFYVRNISKKKKSLNLEVNFQKSQNLTCISHPQIKMNSQYHKLSFEKDLLIIFEKVDLTKYTSLQEYYLEPF